MIGTMVSHYRVEGRLGKGGMGEVYVAEDLRLERKVALKILPSRLASSPEHRARFEREAKAIAALNHPNIVTIYSVEEADGVHFMTMELIRGKTLTEIVPRRGMGLEELLTLAVPLADAVSAAHRQGITHRDLKPDNIMIDEEGRLKVLDFGLAKLREVFVGEGDETSPLAGSVTAEGKILGTVAYMSPEQAEGRVVDPRSDVFSLGIILYEMATGERPFRGDTNLSVISAILKDSPKRVTEVNPAMPPDLARVIHRCLTKEPDRRYQSALDLRIEIEELQRVLLSGRRAATWPNLSRAGAAVLGLLAVIVVVVMSLRGRPDDVPSPERRPTIAVLPFDNLSADADNEYFSNGITEEITIKLSRMSGLEVVSRTSAARFKDSQLDARAIGRQLDVQYLLEGSVRKADRRVRVTAQLVNADSGFQLWAEEFQGEIDDVFQVQEETALKIAEALKVRLSPGEHQAIRRRYTTSPQAYDTYLRGRALLEYFDMPDKLEAARQHLERALEIDPDYPLALVGLSRVEAQYYRNLDPDPARLDHAEALAERALELEPELAEAHLAMGQVYGNRYEYSRAVASFREAIRIEPANAYAWDLLSWSLAYEQPPDPKGAEEAARRSIGLQASLIGAHYHLGRALLLQGRYQEAVAAFEQAKSLDPEFESASFGIGQVLMAQGEYERALASFQAVVKMRDSPIYLVQLCSAHAALGRRDEALTALEGALTRGYRDGPGLRTNPYLGTLRSDPRYVQLLRRFGLEQ